MNGTDQSLLELGAELKRLGYHFVTGTPATHRRVLSRPRTTTTLRDIFGWSRAFTPDAVPNQLLDLMRAAEVLGQDGGELRSNVRFSSLGEHFLVHSAFPTEARDAVFFGPDTYRFARAIREAGSGVKVTRPTIVDIGCGTGAGGLVASGLFPDADVVLSDVNLTALRYSAINARLSGIANVRTVASDVYAAIGTDADFIIANPPYLVDPEARLYRSGGGAFGLDLALRIVEEGLAHLRPGGRLMVYTGTPVIDGTDMFKEGVRPLVGRRHLHAAYEEIDPDVFGEELETPAYADADRIAVVMLTVDREL